MEERYHEYPFLARAMSSELLSVLSAFESSQLEIKSGWILQSCVLLLLYRGCHFMPRMSSSLSVFVKILMTSVVSTLLRY